MTAIPIPVLDHGSVRLVESWGHGDAGVGDETFAADMECGVIEAARQSTQAAFRGWDKGDGRLLAYMRAHNHATPFEFAGMTLEVQAPICVFREWRTHRTCPQIDDLFPGDEAFNEMSARYAPLPDVNYVPNLNRLRPDPARTDAENKQAGAVKGAPELTGVGAMDFRLQLSELYANVEEFYQRWLARGVPKELARLVLPMGRYSRMRVTGFLRNWLAFVALRDHPDAMWEIQEFARAVGTVLESEFPRTWALFDADRRKARA